MRLRPSLTPMITFKLGQDSVGIWVNRVVEEYKAVIFLLNDIVQHFQVDLERRIIIITDI